MSKIDKGFSIIFSFHNEFRGLFPFPQLKWGWENPEGIDWVIHLGWIRIEKRRHIENADRKVAELTSEEGFEEYLKAEV